MVYRTYNEKTFALPYYTRPTSISTHYILLISAKQCRRNAPLGRLRPSSNDSNICYVCAQFHALTTQDPPKCKGSTYAESFTLPLLVPLILPNFLALLLPLHTCPYYPGPFPTRHTTPLPTIPLPLIFSLFPRFTRNPFDPLIL